MIPHPFSYFGSRPVVSLREGRFLYEQQEANENIDFPDPPENLKPGEQSNQLVDKITDSINNQSGSFMSIIMKFFKKYFAAKNQPDQPGPKLIDPNQPDLKKSADGPVLIDPNATANPIQPDPEPKTPDPQPKAHDPAPVQPAPQTTPAPVPNAPPINMAQAAATPEPKPVVAPADEPDVVMGPTVETESTEVDAAFTVAKAAYERRQEFLDKQRAIIKKRKPKRGRKAGDWLRLKAECDQAKRDLRAEYNYPSVLEDYKLATNRVKELTGRPYDWWRHHSGANDVRNFKDYKRGVAMDRKDAGSSGYNIARDKPILAQYYYGPGGRPRYNEYVNRRDTINRRLAESGIDPYRERVTGTDVGFLSHVNRLGPFTQYRGNNYAFSISPEVIVSRQQRLRPQQLPQTPQPSGSNRKFDQLERNFENTNSAIVERSFGNQDVAIRVPPEYALPGGDTLIHINAPRGGRPMYSVSHYEGLAQKAGIRVMPTYYPDGRTSGMKVQFTKPGQFSVGGEVIDVYSPDDVPLNSHQEACEVEPSSSSGFIDLSFGKYKPREISGESLLGDKFYIDPKMAQVGKRTPLEKGFSIERLMPTSKADRYQYRLYFPAEATDIQYVVHGVYERGGNAAFDYNVTPKGSEEQPPDVYIDNPSMPPVNV